MRLVLDRANLSSTTYSKTILRVSKASSSRQDVSESWSIRAMVRSEERRVGKEWRSRWWPYHEKKKTVAASGPDRWRIRPVFPATIVTATAAVNGHEGAKAEHPLAKQPLRQSERRADSTMRSVLDS